MKKPVLLAGCVVVAAAVAAVGADWPQWRGPKHDNLSTETGLLQTWPEGGPKLVWTSEDAGTGYSGPAIVGDRLYTLGSDGKDESVIALDTTSGKKVWTTAIGPFAPNKWGGGPRSTPTVDGDAVYALTASGHLARLNTIDGVRRWTVSMLGKEGLGGNKPGWNYCESPLVDGDHVVCSPGGSRGTLAALDKGTGKVIWRSTELKDPAGYSSIVPTTVGEVRQYVQLTMKGVAGVAARDGRLLWYYRHEKYQTAVIPSPVVKDNFVYAVAGYGAGDVLLQLTPDSNGTIRAKQLYDEDAMRLMNNKHEGVVRVGDYIYGWSDNGGWTCQEFKTGKKVWQSKKLGRGSITCADGHLYCYGEDRGTVVLVKASPEGWLEKGRFNIPRQSKQRSPSGKVWTHPVVANGRLYLRDQELLFCYDLKNGQ